MDSRYLKSLIAVVERGSIADAARAEGLTAAAISQRIQALEREFGFALLTRSGHAARPSEACLNILPRARHIVRQTALLAGDIDPQGLSGTLKIGAISTALTGMLPAALRWLTANAPNIRPTIAPGSSRSLYQAILDQELDAAILVAPPFDLPDTLHGVSLRKEELLLMSRYAPDKSIADMLLQHPYIRYDPETWGGRHPQAFLDDRGLQVHAIGDLDALEAIAMLVADEVGISLVPHWPGLEKLAPTCTLSPVAPEQYQREIILLGPRQAIRPAMIQALLQALHS